MFTIYFGKLDILNYKKMVRRQVIMGENKNITSDEQIFDMQREARKRKKRKYIIILVSIVAVVLIGVIVGVTVLRRQVAKQVGASDGSEVQQAEVTTGSISTTVSGSGTLSDENTEDIEIPNSVEIVEYYVKEGDQVEEGDLIATVTNASVLTAMSEKQAELDALDEEIEEASGDTASTTLSSSVEGRVKKIYVSSGDDVVSAMYENGALILLSLDGYMAVDIETEALENGEAVTVTLSSGTTVKGTVEKQSNGTVTVLVTDNGTEYNDTVTVYDSDSNKIGEGQLYIHSQMAITGYAGTVSKVYVSSNKYVYNGTTLLTLKETETSANYDALLKERKELEEDLNSLIRIYKEGGICAGTTGAIVSLGSSESSTGSATAMSAGNAEGSTGSSGYTTVASIASSDSMSVTISVDENDILSLEEGQTAVITVDSIGEDSFEGTVTEISTTASSSSGVTSYSATVTLEKTENMLSGMSASVVITIEGVENALLIPVDALHQTSSTAYVYTEYDETSGEFSGMIEVTIGLSNSSYVEITSGLSEGDVVYYTESEESSGFGGMSGMPGMSGSSMPDISGNSMPDMSGGSSFNGSGRSNEGSSERTMPGTK